jgi:hypothetical protein
MVPAIAGPSFLSFNSWTAPSTLSAFGGGGAAGYLTVFLDEGSEASACYDLPVAGNPTPGGCAGSVGNGFASASSADRVSGATTGWVWTGT